MNLLRTKLLEKLQEKLNETLKAVLPVIGIVLVLCFTVAPIEPGILLAFLLGGVLLIAIGGMSVLYGIIMLFHNVADWLRQKEYRRNRDMLALDAYRAVRFYQLWAANENRELDLHWAQAVLDEYAASKGG